MRRLSSQSTDLDNAAFLLKARKFADIHEQWRLLGRVKRWDTLIYKQMKTHTWPHIRPRPQRLEIDVNPGITGRPTVAASTSSSSPPPARHHRP